MEIDGYIAPDPLPLPDDFAGVRSLSTSQHYYEVRVSEYESLRIAVERRGDGQL